MTVTTQAGAGEQSRAMYPDEEGYVERDGVRVFWERYGEGGPTILLLPTWTIVHSRVWQAQISRASFRWRTASLEVVTLSGRSGSMSECSNTSRRASAAPSLSADGPVRGSLAQ
jgi:hypothetical protein